MNFSAGGHKKKNTVNDSCIACAELYYPKYDDILKNGNFIKCFNNLDRYYLFNSQYCLACYESCELYEQEFNNIHHNCL